MQCGVKIILDVRVGVMDENGGTRKGEMES